MRNQKSWVLVHLGYCLLSCKMGEVDNINVSKKCFMLLQFCEVVCVGQGEGVLCLGNSVNHSVLPPHSQISKVYIISILSPMRRLLVETCLDNLSWHVISHTYMTLELFPFVQHMVTPCMQWGRWSLISPSVTNLHHSQSWIYFVLRVILLSLPSSVQEYIVNIPLFSFLLSTP